MDVVGLCGPQSWKQRTCISAPPVVHAPCILILILRGNFLHSQRSETLALPSHTQDASDLASQGSLTALRDSCSRRICCLEPRPMSKLAAKSQDAAAGSPLQLPAGLHRLDRDVFVQLRSNEEPGSEYGPVLYPLKERKAPFVSHFLLAGAVGHPHGFSIWPAKCMVPFHVLLIQNIQFSVVLLPSLVVLRLPAAYARHQSRTLTSIRKENVKLTIKLMFDKRQRVVCILRTHLSDPRTETSNGQHDHITDSLLLLQIEKVRICYICFPV
jgi:hypothetical protein